MSSNAVAPSREPHEDDLAITIARERGGIRAGAMAAALFDRDAEDERLVGVVDGAERAVFYRPESGLVVALPFDNSGVDVLGRTEIAHRSTEDELVAYVREAGPEFWDWLHPRYR